MKSNKLRQFVFLGLLAAAGGIWYFDKEQVVLNTLKPLGDAAVGLVAKLRQVGVNQQAKESAVPVTPPTPGVQKSKSRSKPATAIKNTDSVVPAAVPPKDSGTTLIAR